MEIAGGGRPMLLGMLRRLVAPPSPRLGPLPDSGWNAPLTRSGIDICRRCSRWGRSDIMREGEEPS